MSTFPCQVSRYLRVRERRGSVVVFHELHPDPLYCGKSEWELLVQDVAAFRQAGLYQKLVSRGLLVTCDADDDRDLREVTDRLERRMGQPTILYLMLAQGCNFACKYCPIPEQAKRYGERLLSTEDARAGVDLWLEHIRESPDLPGSRFLIFYGGEPLLNKEVIESTIRYVTQLQRCGQSPEDIHFMICTNGVLFDHEMVRLCKEYNITVVVGIDGFGEFSNSLRVDAEGHGTFDKVVPVIRLLVEEGVRACASVCITPLNVNQLGECAGFLEDLGIEKIGFNILKGRLLLQHVRREDLETYYRKAARGIIESARRREEPSFEYQIEKKRSAFESGDFFPDDCTCYGNQIVVQPDGRISNCPFFRAQLGHVRDVGTGFRIWNMPVVQQWRQRLPMYCKEYESADWKSMCGAGCAWSCGELHGDTFAIDEGSKILGEEVFNELIWSRQDSDAS